MKLLWQVLELSGIALLSTLAAAAYLIAFALRLLSAVFVGLTIMMAAADHSTRRGNH